MINPDKGWFKILGLHHACITACMIFIAHFMGMGLFVAICVPSVYLGIEICHARFRAGWTATDSPLKIPVLIRNLEVLDFLTPALVGLIYWVF